MPVEFGKSFCLFVCLFVLFHVDIQQVVRKEVVLAMAKHDIKSSTTEDDTIDITPQLIADLKIVKSVMYEALRLFPVSPFNAKLLIQDTDILYVFTCVL